MTRVCSRCRTPVTETTTQGYAYYCPEHDEDLYEFETTEETNSNKENNKMEEAKKIIDQLGEDIIKEACEEAKKTSVFIKAAIYETFLLMKEKADETIMEKEQEKGEQMPDEIKHIVYGDAIMVALAITSRMMDAVDNINKGDDADAGTNE